MLDLTLLGTIHTAISVLAVLAGAAALVRDKEISPRSRLGAVFVLATAVSALSGFGLFRHGGFGKPHALGVITLIVLGVAQIAGRTRAFGRASRYVEVVSYSTAFFFHFIPGVVETATRLPVGAPLVADREAPVLQAITGGLFVLFLVGAALQVRWLRAGLARERTPAPNALAQ